MEEDSLGIVERMAYKMDKDMATVMPDHWEGHARIVCVGRDLNEEQREKVMRHTRNLLEKKDYHAGKTAEKVIDELTL